MAKKADGKNVIMVKGGVEPHSIYTFYDYKNKTIAVFATIEAGRYAGGARVGVIKDDLQAVVQFVTQIRTNSFTGGSAPDIDQSQFAPLEPAVIGQINDPPL